MEFKKFCNHIIFYFNIFYFLLIGEGVTEFWRFDFEEGTILSRLNTLADFFAEGERVEVGARLSFFSRVLLMLI